MSLINFTLTPENLEEQLLPKISNILSQYKINLEPRHVRSIATRVSLLYFCLEDLASMQPMYTYSLEWFESEFLFNVLKLVVKTEKTSEKINLSITLLFKLYLE